MLIIKINAVEFQVILYFTIILQIESFSFGATKIKSLQFVYNLLFTIFYINAFINSSSQLRLIYLNFKHNNYYYLNYNAGSILLPT